jgi:hypothetical protein
MQSYRQDEADKPWFFQQREKLQVIHRVTSLGFLRRRVVEPDLLGCYGIVIKKALIRP